jgi:hypothetical protein
VYAGYRTCGSDTSGAGILNCGIEGAAPPSLGADEVGDRSCTAIGDGIFLRWLDEMVSCSGGFSIIGLRGIDGARTLGLGERLRTVWFWR